MKLVKQTAFVFLLAVVACAGASAQDVTGRINVTHNTRWGTAVLPAGSYLVSVHSGPVPYVTVTSSDRDNSVSIMAVAQYVETATCKSSSLELEQSAAGWSVRSLCFQSQVSVYFGPGEKAAQARASAAPGPEVGSLSGAR